MISYFVASYGRLSSTLTEGTSNEGFVTPVQQVADCPSNQGNANTNLIIQELIACLRAHNTEELFRV